MSRADEVCYSCHAELENEFRQLHTHTPVRMGNCTACHSGHGSNDASLLGATGAALCSTCHAELMQEKARETLHSPFEEGECLTCHTPHASKDRKFFKEVLHSPFVKGNCEECHVVGRE